MDAALALRPFRVIAIPLPTGEPLPTLVRSTEWIPVRVPTRWAVRRRRFECMPNTLAHDLRAVGLLYEWSQASLAVDLDEMLERFELPELRQLDSLLLALRGGSEWKDPERSLATVANQASAICSFLSWAIDPINQGGAARRSVIKITERRAALCELFRPISRYSGNSERIRPLDSNEMKRVLLLAGPVRDERDAIVLPLRFRPSNPFRVETRLRNWLMIVIALGCGPRRGELLKLRLDDMPRRGEDFIWIRRRPHDRDDSRRYRPAVKTVERQISITEEIRLALSTYLPHCGTGCRRAGRTPYLFVTADGYPLSISAADGLVKVIGRHAGVSDLSWHTFRHTWAEAIAEELLDQHPEEQALAYLRQLGGWTPRSSTPVHYIQNALARQANAFLRTRNLRLYAQGADGSEQSAN